jgi:hypothetical protein
MANETQGRDAVACADQVDTVSPSAGAASEPRRRPYAAPRLRHLGKVADLIFSNSTGSRTDGGKVSPNKLKFG